MAKARPADAGTVTSPKGFLAAGVQCGLKASGKKDLALLVSETPCAAAGVFTSNQVRAAPVRVCQEHLRRRGRAIRAVVVNAGVANACTGEPGLANARAMTEVVGRALELEPSAVLVASTGVIGPQLPMEKVTAGIWLAVQQLSPRGGPDAGQAIMTTDSRAKHGSVQVTVGGKRVTIGGICKGAGMIAPNMATMLCFLTSDVAATPAVLKQALKAAVARSFNSITVDGDQSTNDTVLVLANGQAGNRPLAEAKGADYARFLEGLTQLAQQLAREIVRDGEGATKVMAITVRDARTEAEAKRVGLSIANSNLVKCAMFGNDPNWGRIAAAVGYAPVKVRPEKLSLWLGPLRVVHQGTPAAFDQQAAHELLKQSETIEVTVSLGLGKAEWTVWGSDLTYDYVRINAEYRT